MDESFRVPGVGHQPHVLAIVNSPQERPQASLRRHRVRPRCRLVTHRGACRGRKVVHRGLALLGRSAIPEDPEGVPVGTFRTLNTAFGVLADSYAHQSIKMTTLGQHCQLAVDVSQLQIERFKKED